MADDKSKKVDELGKNELGEVSGGIDIEKLIKKPPFPKVPFHVAKYACPIPPEKRREEILKDFPKSPKKDNDQDSDK